MKPRDVALLCLPAVLLLAAIALPGTKKKVQGDPSQFLGSAEDNSKQLIESNRPSVEYLKSLSSMGSGWENDDERSPNSNGTAQ